MALGAAGGLSALLTAQLAPIAPQLAALITTAPVPPMPLYTLAGLGAACVVVGASLLISDRLKAVGVYVYWFLRAANFDALNCAYSDRHGNA